MTILNGGYPVRVAKLVIVDANFLARTVIKGLKTMISKKLGDRLITVRTEDLAKHFNVRELPPFLGEGQNTETSLAYHARNSERRRKLEATLCDSYGYKFESTPSDTAQWIEVAERPDGAARPRAREEDIEEDEATSGVPAQRMVPRRQISTI